MNSKAQVPYIIAEIGLNHEGDVKLCMEMISEAKKMGCNAVKLQSLDAQDGNIRKNLEHLTTTQKYGEISISDLLEKLLLSDEEHSTISTHCKGLGVDFISTPFGFRHIDILEQIGIDRYKISSQDVIHLELLKKVACKMKPIVIATGMASLGEIETAIKTVRKYNTQEISVLHCVSQYPTSDIEINLRKIETLKRNFDLTIGFSDHTMGITAAIAATVLGAEVIEKHFTYDKTADGWDHAISADYLEMAQLCSETRRAKLMLGESYWKIPESDMQQRNNMRRSIVTRVEMKSGDEINFDNIDFKRPGTGIRPDELKYIVGRKVTREYAKDEVIEWDDIQ